MQVEPIEKKRARRSLEQTEVRRARQRREPAQVELQVVVYPSGARRTCLTDATVVDFDRRGFTGEEIAALAGVTFQAVYARLQRIRAGTTQAHVPASRVIALRDAGWTQAKMGEALGVTFQAISRRLQKLEGARLETITVLVWPRRAAA